MHTFKEARATCKKYTERAEELVRISFAKRTTTVGRRLLLAVTVSITRKNMAKLLLFVCFVMALGVAVHAAPIQIDHEEKVWSSFSVVSNNSHRLLCAGWR